MLARPLKFSDLPPGRRRFEVASVALTVYSIVCLLAEMEVTRSTHSSGWWLWNERVVAAIFTVEYFYRWYTSHDRRKHPFRLMAVIDFISILPFYIGFFADPGDMALIRTLRILRILRLYRHSDSLILLGRAFARCRKELTAVATIAVIITVLCAVTVYHLEHHAQPDKLGRPSDAVWWAVVSMTTVGYGDIAPVTRPGRAVGVVTIFLGLASYGVCITLFGGAWIDILKENRERHALEHNIHLEDGH